MVEVASLVSDALELRIMSKWVLSNVFMFLNLKDAIKVRCASRKMNEACLISFNIGLQDMKEREHSLNVGIFQRFSPAD